MSGTKVPKIRKSHYYFKFVYHSPPIVLIIATNARRQLTIDVLQSQPLVFVVSVNLFHNVNARPFSIQQSNSIQQQ